MDRKNSIVTANSIISAKNKYARSGNISMDQNVHLIWLNKNIHDENSSDCRNTITQLRNVVNTINVFTDDNQCVEFLTTISKKKVCIIISGALRQNIVPVVHNMSQVDSIFIFSGNKNCHKQWTKDWPKIKGVFTEITSICEALKEAVKRCELNGITISFMATTGDASNKNLNRLDCSFMYTHILKEILLTIQFEQQHFQEFINYCRELFADNVIGLANVGKIEETYRDQTPIWWYTSACFLYSMLDRALRLMDVDVIIKMGFFIRDLHQHIEQLHAEQFGNHQAQHMFTVYRGQDMSKSDFEQMMKTKGGLISFNNFLSTSKDRAVSLEFAQGNLHNSDLVGIVFVMTIDPSISTTPFASTDRVSYFKGTEDEVLFSMHTVFRICEIKPLDENNRLWQVDLILTSDNDKELRVLTDRIREENLPSSKGWYRLGLLLLQMGHANKAQEVYEIMLEQAYQDGEKASIYHQLGWTKENQGEYEAAITFYWKSLEIYQKILPANHPDLALSYNNIGNVYHSIGEYSKALSIYEKALEIKRETLPPNHPDLAMSYGNIGNVYDSMGEYSKALSWQYKALEIFQKTLPPTHPNLAFSYNNIGGVLSKIGEYSKALSFYELAMNIGQNSLPTNHPHLQTCRMNLENIKKKL